MLTTANAEWDAQFRLWRQHSMGVPDTVRHGTNQVIFETYDELGYNYRLTDLQAAVGRQQLKRLPEILARRRAQAERYRHLLASIPGLVLPVEPIWARTNWQSYCVRLPAGTDQRQVMQTLLDMGVSTRRGIMSAHRERAYAAEPWSCGVVADACACPAGSCARLAESERAQEQTIILPLFHQLTDDEQALVARALQEACSACTVAV